MAARKVIPGRSLTDRIVAMSETIDNPYLRDAVMTATPEQLQLMLYDGCIRFATQAQDAIRRKDLETSYQKLTRAQHILLEMKDGLNYDANRELCERVASIYMFIYNKLIDACVNRDAEAIDDALKVLRIERETWQMLVDKVSRSGSYEQEDTESPPRPSDEVETNFSAEG